MTKIKVLGLNFENTPCDILAKKILLDIQKKKIHISTVNAAKFIQCRTNDVMTKVVNDSELITIDGVSIVFAAKILGIKKKIYRVSGYDLMEKLFYLSNSRKHTFFFLGSKKNNLLKAVNNVKIKYPKINIIGFNHGYFWKNEKKLINKINLLKPKILLVSITSPLQEEFVFKYKNKLKTRVILLVGGSFDVLSGRLRRAPLFLQKIGLEWLFRLLQEPRRLFWRYLTTNTLFIIKVLKELLKKKISLLYI